MSLFARAPRDRGGSPVGIFGGVDAQRTWGLLQGALPGAAGTPPTRSTPDYLRAYSQMPWLRAVAGRIATAVANADWRLYVAKGSGEPKARAKAARTACGLTVGTIQRLPRAERRKALKALRDKDELQPVEQHPLLTLLGDANEFHTGLAMRKVTQLHLDLVGDAFWLKERDALGTPVAVWPIPPHWVVSTPTPGFRFFRVTYRAWRALIPDTEWVWFSEVDPLNPYGRGSGAAMALGDELETDEYAARHSKAFFYNQARPDLLVWPKGGRISPAQARRLEEDWLGNSQGFFRAFRPYFLTQEVEVKALDQSFRAQQFVQLREFERNAVMQHYGVPPEILGVLSNSNRATINAADYFMAKYVTEPRVEFQRQVLQERVAPEYDERLIVDYEPLAGEDDDQQYAAAKDAPWSLTIDEWRAMSGREPLGPAKGGDLHAIPTEISFGKVEEPPPPPPQLAPFAGGDPPKPGDDAQDQPKPPKPPADGADPDAEPPDPAVDEKGWITAAIAAGDVRLAESLATLLKAPPAGLPPVPAVAARQERRLAEALAGVWRAHGDGLSARALESALAPSGTAGDVVMALRLPALNQAQAAVLRGALADAVLQGARLGARHVTRRAKAPAPQAQLDLAAVNPLATAWAQAHAADLLQADPDTREVVRLLVEGANAEGVTVAQLARELRTVIGLRPDQVAALRRLRARLLGEGLAAAALEARLARYAEALQAQRAMLISRTELLSALNHGQQLAWDVAVAQGVLVAGQFRKQWIATAGACDECADLDGEETEIGDDFSNGDDQPPAHPDCRCTTGLVDAEGRGTGEEAALPPAQAIHVHVGGAERRVELARDAEGVVTGAVVRDGGSAA